MKYVVKLSIFLGLLLNIAVLEARGGRGGHGHAGRGGHHAGHHDRYHGRGHHGYYGHGWRYGGWYIASVPFWAATLGWTLAAGMLYYQNKPITYYQQNEPEFYQTTLVPQLDQMHAEQPNHDAIPVSVE